MAGFDKLCADDRRMDAEGKRRMRAWGNSVGAVLGDDHAKPHRQAHVLGQVHFTDVGSPGDQKVLSNVRLAWTLNA